MSVIVSYKKQTVLVLLMFLIILVVVEIFATLFVIHKTTCEFKDTEVFENVDPKLVEKICNDYINLERLYNKYYQLTPNQYSDTMSINEFGFRGSDFSYEKPHNTFRIFLVGGSAVFGVGSSSDETTISGYLQKNLNNLPLSYSFQVINAGSPGANSFGESELTEDVLLQFDPDMIIVYDGWNDIQLYDVFVEVSQERETVSLFLRDIKVLFPFYSTPVLISEIGIQIIHVFSEPISITDDMQQQKIIWWQNNWSTICELSHEQGFDVVLSIQPIIGSGNKPLSVDEKQILFSDPSFVVDAKLMSDYVSGMYDLEQCKYSLDLTSSFDNVSEPIYFDQGHMSDNGNLIIAEKFAEFLYPILKNEL